MMSSVELLRGVGMESTGAFEVVARSAKNALQNNSHIFNLKLMSDGIGDITGLLDLEEPPANISLEDMKYSLFKVDYMEKTMGDMNKRMNSLLERIERIPSLDYELLEEYKEKMNDENFNKMFSDRSKLPAFKMRDEIVRMIDQNQVTLISGDTGCGKTTQIPQYILDEFINSGNGSLCRIICTQPRRISAISVAERISKERAESIGKSCGYQVRVEKELPRKQGSILLATNGMVLRFMESNPTLNDVSHLILDEIHERDSHTDFLLAVVKQLITERSDIKIVLMSATLNEESFRSYFNNCPHIKVDRLSYDVEEFFLEDVVERLNFKFPSNNRTLDTVERNKRIFKANVLPYVQQITRQGICNASTSMQLQNPMSEELNLDLIYALTMDICSNETPGGILIFVTGFEDIKKLKMKFDKLSTSKFVVITLHSQLPMEQQKIVFESAPPNVRKIIISTNLAETSITVEDVVYVIDSGWCKIKTYNGRTKTECLKSKFIAKANAIQRKGRAGRTCPGKCYRLYTKARFEAFFDYQKPEIKRSRLEDIILQAKLLGFRAVQKFFNLLMDHPKPLIVERSLNILKQIGALEDPEQLTPLGYYLAKLPVSPQLGKMLLYGLIFRCLDPIVSVVVGLDYKNPFMLKFGQSDTNEKLRTFSESCKSDHLLLYKALHLFINTDQCDQQDLCQKFDLNIETMTMLVKLKVKVMEILWDLTLVLDTDPTLEDMNENSNNIVLLKSIITAGLYPNIVFGRTHPERSYVTPDRAVVGIQKNSVVFHETLHSVSLISYFIKFKNGRWDLLRDATLVSPFPLFFFGESEQVHVPDSNNLILLTTLKKRFQRFFISKLTNPGSTEEHNKNYEDRLIKTMVRLLSCSEIPCSVNYNEEEQQRQAEPLSSSDILNSPIFKLSDEELMSIFGLPQK